jgi:hypothetical protein
VEYHLLFTEKRQRKVSCIPKRVQSIVACRCKELSHIHAGDVYTACSKTVLVGSRCSGETPHFFAVLIYILNCTYIAKWRLACFVASCIMYKMGVGFCLAFS